MTLPTFFELQFLVLYVCKPGAIAVERPEAGTRPATQQAEHPSVRKKDQRPGEDYRHRRVWKQALERTQWGCFAQALPLLQQPRQIRCQLSRGII